MWIIILFFYFFWGGSGAIITAKWVRYKKKNSYLWDTIHVCTSKRGEWGGFHFYNKKPLISFQIGSRPLSIEVFTAAISGGLKQWNHFCMKIDIIYQGRENVFLFIFFCPPARRQWRNMKIPYKGRDARSWREPSRNTNTYSPISSLADLRLL